MAKAASKVVGSYFDAVTRTIVVHVAHTPEASYSRSVDPAAWKACKVVAKANGISGTLNLRAAYGTGKAGQEILSEFYWAMS